MMKIRFKGKKAKTFFSGLLSRGRELGRGAGTDASTSALPNIIVQGESSEAVESLQNTTEGGNPQISDLSDDRQSTTTSAQYSDTPNISENEDRGFHIDASTSFFSNSQRFSVKDSHFVNQSTHIINPGVGDREAQAKKLLSKHMIPGAAHNSSARDPPPKCHPGTRIKINESVIAWFYDKTKRESILWIYGPAGVGKSAIVQTLAEALASAECLGASVFFSRPNGRNQSHGVFITVAYQLSVHIEPYHAFVSEKLSFDPDLVNQSMEEQFKAFIVEPFALKKIGADGRTWGILLDGLDELDHHDQQKKIIRLVTTFAHDYPEVPLAWVIASRPEPRITNTFKQQNATSSYRKEHVPIDSSESCQDVERFLRTSFQSIQQEFSHMLTQSWPEEAKIVKLAHAASGLFAFADVAARYIGDPRHSDPMARLDYVLSSIDGSRVGPADDQPFAYLDALYTRILTDIPSTTWPATQRVLGAVSFSTLDSAMLLSVVLGLELSKVYGSINDFYSLLDVPPLDDVYFRQFRFHHASFDDFLRDETRSRKFYTSRENTKSELNEGCLRIWRDFKKQISGGPSSEYRDRWLKYTSQFHSEANRPADVLRKFDDSLSFCVHAQLFFIVEGSVRAIQEEHSQHNWDKLHDLLCQIDAGTVCHGFHDVKQLLFIESLFKIWKTNQEELGSRAIAREIRLEQLRLDHLEWPQEYPTHIQTLWRGEKRKFKGADRVEPDSPESFNDYISGVKYFQQCQPTLSVLIYGTRGNQYAIFKYQYTGDDFKTKSMHTGEKHFKWNTRGHYCFPYPDDV